ncbi:MAG: TauD/TfdA family dioxygenase [Sulfitobacter sp.]|nr:TauD/TfdA family dioxygenase [Sulfitobacter sp.]
MTSPFQTTPLTDCFGVEVHGPALADLSETDDFPHLRALFEEHSALLFRNQDLNTDDHMRLAEMFGPIEDRKADERKPGEGPEISMVSNQTEEGVTGEMDLHTLNLKANQQWHIDSTFLPTPALCNILVGKVVTETGGRTELASSRAAYATLPQDLKERIAPRILRHNNRRSRERQSMELADLPMFNKWPPQRWPAVWRNPVNGREALYIASHVFEVEGLAQEDGEALIEDLIAFCTQPQFVYSHRWQVGDVLIWDQRAVLHRGTPWPYDEPRTLASVCCSLTPGDGLAEAHRLTQQS